MRRIRFSLILRKAVAIALCYSSATSIAWAQQASIEPVRPMSPTILRPYQPPQVPPLRLANSGRLSGLMRGGTLYLTAQDAIALALENNIDIEVARYSPILSQWQLVRAEAGGALPGVPSGAAQAGSVASGQGVAGSQAAAGVSGTGGSVGARGTGNATISQVGPITQNLDPTVQQASTFSHRTTPQFNATQSVTQILISDTRVYSGSYQQGFLTGGAVTVSYTDHYLKENALTDVLNPSVAPNLSLSFQHNLLRGFGIAVNARTITVAKINLSTSDLTFKTQLIRTVTQVLTAYYALVAGYQDIKAKQSAVELAQTLYEDNQKQVQAGTLIPLDVTRAGAQVANTQRDLITSQTNLQQQELQLKNLISRTGVAEPELRSARIVPLDSIVIPDRDELAPLADLAQRALASRSDIATERAGLRTAEVNALGTRNGILPSSQVFGGVSNAGLAGVAHTVITPRGEQRPDPYFVGNIGTALGQIFRRNFPTERIGAFFATQLGNRVAQADYGIDQLQLRQRQLSLQKDINQVTVDVANAVVALQQARARYDAAVKNRELAEQLLAAEQKKYSLGASVPYNVILEQRDLATAQSSEISALVGYNSARISLDETLGATLETNRVSITEAQAGRLARTSSLPATLPQTR